MLFYCGPKGIPLFHMNLKKDFRSERQSFETAPQRRVKEHLSLTKARKKISKGGEKEVMEQILQETFYFDKKVEEELLGDSKEYFIREK